MDRRFNRQRFDAERVIEGFTCEQCDHDRQPLERSDRDPGAGHHRDLRVCLGVPVGAELIVTFDAPPGTYQYICAIPGHPEAGMKGSLIVTDD